MKARGKRVKGKAKGKKTVVETSSEESYDEMYEDSSEAESKDYEYSRCAECDVRFAGVSKRMAVGCDSDHCGCWYHPKCTDLDLEGKDEEEIRALPFICRYC